MLWYLNRYSYFIFTTLAIGMAALIGARLRRQAGPLLAVAVGAVLATVQVKLSGRSSEADWASVQARTRRGRPTLLFAYSDT